MTHGLDLRHSHGLETISGYRVVETIRDGKVLETFETVATFEGAGTYGKALEAAYAIRLRDSGSWAKIETLYECGCNGGG